MPISNYSKGNSSSSKKSRRMRRSHNKNNLMQSPEPTPRDIPEVQNAVDANIEDVAIEILEAKVDGAR